jgi:hypothetical protein
MSWLSKWVYGTDQTPAELQAQGDALDAQLAAKDKVDYAPGGRIYDAVAARDGNTDQAEANYAAVVRDLDTGATGDVQKSIDDAAYEGFKDSYPVQAAKTVAAAPGKALGAVKDAVNSVVTNAGNTAKTAAKGVATYLVVIWVLAILALVLIWKGRKFLKFLL